MVKRLRRESDEYNDHIFSENEGLGWINVAKAFGYISSNRLFRRLYLCCEDTTRDTTQDMWHIHPFKIGHFFFIAEKVEGCRSNQNRSSPEIIMLCGEITEDGMI